MDSAPPFIRPSRLPAVVVAKLPLVVVPVVSAAFVVVLAAVTTLDRQPLAAFAGAAVLFVAATVAEAFPVPIVGVAAGSTSLATIFIVATSVLYSWQLATLVGLLTMLLVEVWRHKPLIRVVYNASLYSLAGAAAGAVAIVVPVGQRLGLLGACAFYLTDILLLAAVVAAADGDQFLRLLRRFFGSTLTPFLVMASTTAILVVLWERAVVLGLLVVPPLVAIALYQRSTFRELRAMRLALTDPLTGLGNHRHFHERLERELNAAEAESTALTICLFDIDDFKRVNDQFGHPTGDRVLAQVADRLRQGGEAFRLGGDEFALLLPGLGESAAVSTVESIVERVALAGDDEVGAVTVSAGVITFPLEGAARDDLLRLADAALYWAKEHGKNHVRVYRPELVELAELEKLAGADRAARYRAAASLAQAIDARDAYTGSHSARVSELAVSVAARLGLDQEQIELTRLAASLHDLGKLAIPEEILRKAGTLTSSERLVLERHPQIGFRMLASLGLDAVAHCVLHHHERWDGGGYPHGLEGDEIPLSARIIFVADAFDAMTSDRAYRRRLTPDAALAELERCAGSQFDPSVVAAFTHDARLDFAPPLALAS